MKKLPKSIRKHIRGQKAKIRRQSFSLGKNNNFEDLYNKFKQNENSGNTQPINRKSKK